MKRNILLIALVFVVTSCGLWRDFTTYFNTYFNASRILGLVEDELNEKITDPFEFKENKITQQQSQQLTKVIEKCSKILQFDKESSYFTDALFMTGKAFYYQGEYSKAQRKFSELAAVQESDYSLINQVWLARTNLQLRNFDEGLAQLDEVIIKAKESEEEEIYIEASIKRIGFLIYREDYANAAKNAADLISNIDDDEINALVSYKLGTIYLKTNELQLASEAFYDVNEKYSPSFDVEFKSLLELAKLQKQLDKVDQSYDLLIDLSENNKYRLFLDQIFYEIGDVYTIRGEYDKAIDEYVNIDTTFRQSPYSGLAEYRLGGIYEFNEVNYDSSRKYYYKASSNLIGLDVREKKAEASKKALIFDRYFTLVNEIKSNKKALEYIADPLKFERDSIDFKVTMEKIESDKQLNAANQQFRSQSGGNNSFQNQFQTQPSQPPVANDPNAVQYTTPTNTNTPNINALSQYSSSDKNDLSLESLIIQGKVLKPVMPKISADSVNSLLASNYYNLGNLFFSEIEDLDSAYTYYDKVINEYPKKGFTPQSIYAIGTIYETENNKEKADSLFNIIIENYENSPLHLEAGKKLGLVKVETKSDPAEKLYLVAENKMFDKNYNEAIIDFRNIYNTYPTSAFAPKAIYAAGLIYEENLVQYDSAAAYYEILNKEYAVTPFAKQSFAKLTGYQAEQKALKLKKEEEQKKLSEAAKSAKPLFPATDSTSISKNKLGKIDSSISKKKNSKLDSTMIKKAKIEIDTSAASIGLLNAVSDSLSKASMKGELKDSSEVKKIPERKVFKDIPDEVKRKIGLPVDSTKAKKDELLPSDSLKLLNKSGIKIDTTIFKKELEGITPAPPADSTKKLIEDDI
ncbi:MAG: tetratricopeptide repeat protein [Ignavibacteriaceae bacterium]|nr:tetratricopeptide repeat protein [Ignavibacteriaceae bacterium]